VTPRAGARRADLHAHTTASDGLYTPERLVALCREAGLWAVAVTDHDSLAAVAAAQAAGRREGVTVWPGVELGALAEGEDGGRLDVHLLGLCLDDGAQADAAAARLEAHLAGRRRARLERGREMVRRLTAAGVRIDWQTVARAAAGGAVGRPHVARALIAGGYARDIDDAFARYLSRGRPGHVEQAPLAVAEAVDWLREAGCAVVWAHPGLTRIDAASAPWLGLVDGLEADHPKHAAATRRALRRLARARGLVATGGSDCHGTDGREAVGVCTTSAAAVARLRARARTRRRG
jgi:predicted metal-dependent phosphoesterase TrpH